MYYSTTSFSGESPKWLWEEFKEIPPNDQNTNDRQVCAIAVYVAMFRYEFLSDENQQMLEDILRDQVPSPESYPGGSVAKVLFDEVGNMEGGN